jgi:hypothetical protein
MRRAGVWKVEKGNMMDICGIGPQGLSGPMSAIGDDPDGRARPEQPIARVCWGLAMHHPWTSLGDDSQRGLGSRKPDHATPKENTLLKLLGLIMRSTVTWYQLLVWTPDQLSDYCALLARDPSNQSSKKHLFPNGYPTAGSSSMPSRCRSP